MQAKRNNLSRFQLGGACPVDVDLDELTGLLRFQAFQRVCADRRLFNQPHGVVLVVFVDADNLKLINDSLGHTVGDGLIVEIGASLSECLPDRAVLCRKGGDEFVAAVLCDSTNHAQRVTDNLLHALRKTCSVAGHEILLSCSIGVSIEPSNTTDLSRQSNHADIAMYWAKKCGKNQLKVYDEGACSELVMMHALSMQFSEALESGELSIAFQPIYSMGVRNYDIMGAEALIRWQHSRYGDVPAEKILQLASKSGRVADLGRFVVRKACLAATRWPASKFVCVNFSAADFLRIDFADSIGEILDEVGLPAHRLNIEITESEVLELNEVVQNNVNLLRERGVRVGVDDFGTGYSSMGNIDGFPADFVKIDRSLISGCDHRVSSRIFIKAIKSVADKIGFDLVAEGIETIEELAIIRGAGISAAQGYYFCKPIAPSDTHVLMHRAETGGLALLRPIA